MKTTLYLLIFNLLILIHSNCYAYETKQGNVDLIFKSTFENDCTLTISPIDSFIESFSQLTAGDTLCLNDGKYQQAMDIPSNIHVKALNNGKAEIDGGSSLGEQWTGGLLQMHGENSSVQGLRVHHAHNNSDACNINGTNNTMRITSCAHGGWHKHKKPLTIHGNGHLIENSWFFGKGRYVVECFKCRNVTLRQNVARWDITTDLTPSEPNASFAIYNSSDITIENNISLDYAFSTQDMRFGADFYSPQNCNVWPEGNNYNHYLGNYSINHAEGNMNRKGLRLEADCTSIDNVVKDFYVSDSDYGIVISSRESGLSLSNCSFTNILIQDISGGGTNAGLACNGQANLGAKYIDREKVSNDLFPWPYESLIKQDMCRTGERVSEWCTTNLTLSEYILP